MAWLVHLQSPDEHGESRYYTQTQGETPHSPEMIFTETKYVESDSSVKQIAGVLTSRTAPEEQKRIQRSRNRSWSLNGGEFMMKPAPNMGVAEQWLTGGESEPTMLCVFGYAFFLGLFRSSHWTAGILSTNSDSKEETTIKILEGSMRNDHIERHPPACTKHSK